MERQIFNELSIHCLQSWHLTWLCIVSAEPQRRCQMVRVGVCQSVGWIHTATHHHCIHCPVKMVVIPGVRLPPPHTPSKAVQSLRHLHPHIPEGTHPQTKRLRMRVLFCRCRGDWNDMWRVEWWWKDWLILMANLELSYWNFNWGMNWEDNSNGEWKGPDGFEG